MTEFRVTLSEVVEAPEGTEIVVAAPTGNVMGFRLPDGKIIRAWICYELEDEKGEHHDLTASDMNDLGFDTDIELERDIQPT